MEDNRLPKQKNQNLDGEIVFLKTSPCLAFPTTAILRSHWRASLFNGAALMEQKLKEKAKML